MGHNKKAFTLIELLVVVAIMSLLIAILLPSLEQARGTARVVTCGVNARTIAIGLSQYVNEQDGVLPPLKSSPYQQAGGDWWFRTLHLQGYLPDGRADKEMNKLVSGFYHGIWQCPSVTLAEMSKTSGGWGGGYGQNSSWVFQYPDRNNMHKKLGSIRPGDLRRPAGIWLIGDTGKPTDDQGNYVTWPGFFRNNPYIRFLGASQQPACRHVNELAFVAFADIHVETRTFAELDRNAGNIFGKDTNGDGIGD